MLTEGTQLGNYVIEALVGAGGMSGVYRARHRALGSVHALKVLHRGHHQDPEVRDRFLKEGQVLAQLRHPALVRVTDVVYEDGVAALVMDHLDGHDLSQRLKSGPLSLQEAADLMLQALAGVAHAHGERVFHRDLKPANLFLMDRGEGRAPLVKVLDFGIAKVADSFVTRGDETMGTTAYMSPEQIQHPGEVDARSDVFSLGAVLFEMVGGYRPFSADTDLDLMKRIVGGERRYIPDQAGPLGPVLRRALETDPNQRFPTAQAFADAIAPVASTTVRARVAGWRGTGKIETDALDSARDRLVSPPPPPPEMDPRLVRRLGALQLASGLINVAVMSVVQCFGLGALGGLPACFAVVPLVVGFAEIASGLRAVLFRSGRWIQFTAWLELFSILGLSVVSTVVGIIVMVAGRRRFGPDTAERP